MHVYSWITQVCILLYFHACECKIAIQTHEMKHDTVYWESSAEENVREFHESGSIRECFLVLFNLGWNFYI